MRRELSRLRQVCLVPLKKQEMNKVSVIFLWMAVLFDVCLIASNLFETKAFMLWGWCVLPAADVIFPVSYVINDCISEVYGLKKARLVIWTGFAMNLLFVLLAQLVLILPGAPFWEGQEAYQFVLGSTPKVAAASLAAFFVGSNLNAFVMTRMKASSGGKRFGIRAIVSSVVGELADSMIFIPIVFWGSGFGNILLMIGCEVAAKVLYELLVLPVTAQVVKRVKFMEGAAVQL